MKNNENKNTDERKTLEDKLDNEYGIYSYKLGRVFSSVEDMRAAEAKKAAEDAEKERAKQAAEEERKKAVEQRKADADAVKAAREAYEAQLAKSRKEIEEVHKAYTKVLNDFIKKYGSWHESYSQIFPAKSYSLFDVMDSIIKNMQPFDVRF